MSAERASLGMEQWGTLQADVELLSILLDFSDDQQHAIAVHLGLANAEADPKSLEPACWMLRSVFDEWRRTAITTRESEPTGSARTSSYQRSTMVRLLGQREPYQAPQSFAEITAGGTHHETPSVVTGMHAMFGELAVFVTFEADEHPELIKELAALRLQDPADSTTSKQTTQLYPSPTGPTLLGDPDASALRAYMVRIKNHPLLSIEEEQILARHMQEGAATEARTARQILIAHNLRWAAALAFRAVATRPGPVRDVGDIIQYANLELIRSADKFEPGRGARLASFAARRIFAGALRGIQQEGIFMVGGRWHQQERLRLLETAHEQTAALEDEEVTRGEVAQRLGYGLISLEDIPYQPPDPKGAEAFERVEDDIVRQMQARALWKEIEAIETLSPRELRVLRLRYQQGLTGREAGEAENGISHQAISVIENRALDKVRTHFGQEVPPVRFQTPSPVRFLEACGVSPAEDNEAARVAACKLLKGSALPDRTKRILTLRFGLDSERPEALTRPATAQLLGISTAMVKHYETAGINTIKKTGSSEHQAA